MIDYILRFPNKETAEQFGLANGFAFTGEDGELISNIASHEHALLEIGHHNGENYWILFRDLIGIPIPDGGEQFIYWSSSWKTIDENGNEILIPRPESNPDVPNIFWI